MTTNTPPLFSDFSLDASIQQAISAAGYTQPTPIQAQAIPVVMQGRDVMGAAQTGTGKTASFSLPIIQNLLPQQNSSMSPARHPVRALILTPTRELADQVADNVRQYSQFTQLRSAAVYGGVDMQPQTAALRGGVEILIATPGRLLDHVGQKNVNLSQVQMLVLDEADRMLDMGFMPDLQRILDFLPKQRQTLLFSATFSDEIKKLSKKFLQNPVTIEVARSNATADTVKQMAYDIPGDEHKRAAVSYLIREFGLTQVIVFLNTKIGASRLTRELQREGIAAEAIHGDKSQIERMKALDGFKAGSVAVLVATDVAARGLDISELPCVINCDLPFSPEDYVHRIGRTGRAGNEGEAISLVTPDDEKLLSEIEKLIKRPLERRNLPASAYQLHRRREEAREGIAASQASARRRQQPTIDPWFLQPYQPSTTVAPETATESPPSAATGRATRPGSEPHLKPRAALFGGLGGRSSAKKPS
ncbi:DEAD/DEAH box helicase [Parvibium lacunae]|uniref:DEAD-box ATP-dependent RNA helicase RhpA n=1 Tax=Parvibium lacunae TaxID=1888893 RepID=A0A368L4C4_9BURK|nr:DEAD/DEAH box helicase [Parvibium lacunae]RCS58436.1 ATP-dependent helicase [Parvibium lacunae]